MSHPSLRSRGRRTGLAWCMLVCLCWLGCESDGSSADCVIETSYLCVEEGCFCSMTPSGRTPSLNPKQKRFVAPVDPRRGNPSVPMHFPFQNTTGLEELMTSPVTMCGAQALVRVP